MTYNLQDSQNALDSPEREKINSLFNQYKKEMLYLRNFSEMILRLYQEVFNGWMKYVGEMPTEKNLSRFVLGMRESGLAITTCNIHIRSFNSFLTWLKDNNHCPQTFTNKGSIMAIPKEILDELLKDYQKPEDLLGPQWSPSAALQSPH
jgi:hypothetical protein